MSQEWWDGVPDPEHPRHHEGCSDDCEYKPLPEGHAGRQDFEEPRPAWWDAYTGQVEAKDRERRRAYYAAREHFEASSKMTALLLREHRPESRPSRASLALAWMKGFVTAMAEIKLSDWSKALHMDVEQTLVAPPGKPKRLPVIFTDDGEAWTPVYEAQTGSGPYRNKPTGLRRITPDEAALVAMQAADRARRFATFALGLTLANVLIQVLRLVFG